MLQTDARQQVFFVLIILFFCFLGLLFGGMWIQRYQISQRYEICLLMFFQVQIAKQWLWLLWLLFSLLQFVDHGNCCFLHRLWFRWGTELRGAEPPRGGDIEPTWWSWCSSLFFWLKSREHTKLRKIPDNSWKICKDMKGWVILLTKNVFPQERLIKRCHELVWLNCCQPGCRPSWVGGRCSACGHLGTNAVSEHVTWHQLCLNLISMC